MRLTPKMRCILLYLNIANDTGATSAEIGETLVPSRHGRREWALGTLSRLLAAGLVFPRGDTPGARVWVLTPKGRKIVADIKPRAA